ncbi:apolipoprotein N-acyltransferase [Nocardiopsis alborubida]|uniref:Apolipoprotein N-acyltransferase n=1 Tax=Nocardiopsis alborubida TaxID=146802 RepID=A0A7X6RTC6_9ACTN|nr:apolipoprotein N-acyltransferase [Nocardiopsis alborubida]NKZ01243.1 apolipoprotein N-acyltransferase [Nocardiopsis alborubida]
MVAEHTEQGSAHGSDRPSPEPVGRERTANPARSSVSAFALGHRWGRHDLLWRVLAAVGSGLAQLFALPPYGLWWLGPLSAALLALAVAGSRMRRAAWLGALSGAALMVPLVHWQDIFGIDVWLLIAGAETVYFLPMAMALALAMRLPGWPLWTAALWVAQEALRARWPLGGFPWGKLAFAQPDTPFVGYAALGSSALVTFAVALTGGLLLWSALRLAAGARWAGRGDRNDDRDDRNDQNAPRATDTRKGGPPRSGWVPAALGLVAGAAVVVGGTLAPAIGRPDVSHTVTVGMVQGNVPNVGQMSIAGERMQVLNNHADGVHELADAVRAGEYPRPDMVLLPENASDIDPFRDPQAREIIDAAAADAGVPLLWGMSRFNDDGTRYVSSVVWDPEAGPGEIYDKRYLVPFGEYVPFRDFFTQFVSRLQQVSSDAVPGSEPGALAVGDTTLAVGICFDVAFDLPVRESVAAGGQVIVIPTNNANYNFTGQTNQQLAITQLRAVEHGRPAVVVSTSGVSAVVNPDGTLAYSSPEGVPDIHVAELEAMEGTTVATRLGAVPEALLSALGLGAAVVAVVLTRRRRV